VRQWLDTNPTRARPAEHPVSPDGALAHDAGLLGAAPPGEPAR
jgi:hypothetical protein